MTDVQKLSAEAKWGPGLHRITGHSTHAAERAFADADGVRELVEGVSECNLDLALELVERLRTRGFQLQTSLKITSKNTADQWQQKAVNGRPHTDVEAPDTASSWELLPDDIVLRICESLSSRDMHMMACTCAGWRAPLSSAHCGLSFTWAGDQVNNAARGASVLFHAVVDASFQQCTALLDDAVAQFAYGSCSHLEALDLAGCRKVTDTGMAAVAGACPKLRHLNISSCHLVTDWGFAQLGHHCRELRTLKACGCDRLGDAGLQALASGARHLQELNVGWCEHLSSSSLITLAACCPDMRILDLCGCHKVTNEAVEAVARSCTRLENLGLYCCRRLTDASMHAVADDLTTLQHINVSGCRSLGREALQAVLNSNPQLHTCRSMHCNVIIGGCLALLDVQCRCPASTASGASLY